MKSMFYLFVYFLLISVTFSQSPKYDLLTFTNSNKLQIDSSNLDVQISALLNFDRFDKFISTGTRWGSYGIGLGVAAVLISGMGSDHGFEYIVIPGLFGIIGAAGGLAYGAFSDMADDYNSENYKFGLQINMGQTMSAQSYRYIANIGIIFRYPNKSYLTPDNYTIYIGVEELNENSKENKHSTLELTKYGVQLKKVGYNRTLNFLYGIDFGQSKGSYSYSIEEGLSYFRSEWENVSSFYFDIIIGVNLNLTKNIHGSIEYQYELIGASTDDDVSSIFDNPARGVTSFSIYTFLW